MTQFQGKNERETHRGAVVGTIAWRLAVFGRLFAIRSAGLMLARVVIFSLIFSLPAHAEGPGDHGGLSGGHGGAGGPRGAGGPGAAHEPGGHGSHERHRGRGKEISGSRWNDEDFFDDDRPNLDHQRALAGVTSGRYRSLKQIIRIVGIPASSRIVRMDLRSLDGADVYSIVVRNAAGHVERMTVNAETGERID
jgi:hypothetical protein